MSEGPDEGQTMFTLLVILITWTRMSKLTFHSAGLQRSLCMWTPNTLFRFCVDSSLILLYLPDLVRQIRSIDTASQSYSNQHMYRNIIRQVKNTARVVIYLGGLFSSVLQSTSRLSITLFHSSTIQCSTVFSSGLLYICIQLKNSYHPWLRSIWYRIGNFGPPVVKQRFVLWDIHRPWQVQGLETIPYGPHPAKLSTTRLPIACYRWHSVRIENMS